MTSETEIILEPNYFRKVFIHASGFTFKGKKIDCKDSVQKVVQILGTPNDAVETKQRLMYFYFELGIEVEFSDYRVSMFGFHANQVMHHKFNKYSRCNFDYQSITPWSKVQDINHDSPVVVNTVFGNTYFHKYGNFIYEITEKDDLATIMLFDPDFI